MHIRTTFDFLLKSFCLLNIIIIIIIIIYTCFVFAKFYDWLHTKRFNQSQQTCFLSTNQELIVFPRLAPVACFPALGAGCMFLLCDWFIALLAFVLIGQIWSLWFYFMTVRGRFIFKITFCKSRLFDCYLFLLLPSVNNKHSEAPFQQA